MTLHFLNCFWMRCPSQSTTMFRNPGLFLVLRQKVLPYLKSYPSLKIWHAGCATGQEAYSLSIVLKEENLAKRTVIYATDFNDNALDTAKKGIYDIKDVKNFTKNYQAAGGKRSFSEYYHAEYDAIKIRQNLKAPITFANHNLAIDGVFSETQLIMCRNVLIYFDKNLQDRVLKPVLRKPGGKRLFMSGPKGVTGVLNHQG